MLDQVFHANIIAYCQQNRYVWFAIYTDLFTLVSKIIFMKYLPPVRPKMVLKLKIVRIYWNLAHLIFQVCRSLFECLKQFLWNIYHLLYPNSPKIKNAQNLLKFGRIDISNMPISILMSKISFMKYLPPVRPKLAPKLKMFRIYWYLAQLIFQIYWFRF